MKILALGHRKRVGKNTLAQFITTHLRTTSSKLNIQSAGFADEIKRITHHLFGWAGLMHGAYYEDHPLEREIVLPALGKTPRRIWIEFGNKVREVYEDAWLDFLLLGTKCDILIITDLRYPNEFTKVHAKGGFCQRIDRPDVPITHDVADDALADIPINDWDRIYVNKYGLNGLNVEAEFLANLLLRML